MNHCWDDSCKNIYLQKYANDYGHWSYELKYSPEITLPVIANSRLGFRPNSVEGWFPSSGRFDGYIAHLVNSIAVTFSSICYFNYWAFDCIACSNFYQKYRKQKSLRQEFEHSVIKWHIQFCIVLEYFYQEIMQMCAQNWCIVNYQIILAAKVVI